MLAELSLGMTELAMDGGGVVGVEEGFWVSCMGWLCVISDVE